MKMKCLPVTVKVINDILNQRRGHGLMDVPRRQGCVPLTGSWVPRVIPMDEVGPSSLASRKSSVNGDWLVGGSGQL